MMEENKRSFGSIGEKIAVDYLVKNKFKIMDMNYRVGKMGEIDIIARENEYICFIEVKTRKSTIYGRPCEAVTKSKQRNIRRLASIYLTRFGQNEVNARFDVVEIIYNKEQGHEINLIKNAF